MPKHLLPLIPAGLVIDRVVTGPERVIVTTHPSATRAICPACGRSSSRTHSQYLQLVSGRAQKDPNASKFDPFAPAPGTPLKTYVAKDACLFTATQVAGHPMKVDMGSLYPLDAALRKAGGRCYFDETNAGHMTLTCHYPDGRRQTMHELALEGDNDNAGCYGVDSIKLDDKSLPYAQYNRIFVQHR